MEETGLSKKKGLYVETIVEQALIKAIDKGNFEGQVYWNQKPDTMSIETDFTVGIDPNHPEFIILCTSSNSARNAELKFWRNQAELQEAKVCVTKSPRVISIFFQYQVKKRAGLTALSLYDETIILENKDYFTENEWKTLYRLSENTFIDETESLKQGAAGAGLTDND